jgi:hypothetical protein
MQATWAEDQEAVAEAWVAAVAAAGVIAGDRSVEVVGESRYQHALHALAGDSDNSGPLDRRVLGQLVPEPQNRYDSNAVAVYLGGQVVGHLSREDAEEYQGALIAMARRGHSLGCLGELTGGFLMRDGRRASIGLVLHIVEPEWLAA